MKSWITLNELRLHAYHGVQPQERLCGNLFILNLRLAVDISQVAETDDIADAVNYAEVYDAVRAEMAQSSRLLEHVAMRVVRRIFLQFPSVEEIQLKLEKLNPPMNADIRTAGVEIDCQRNECMKN